MTFSNNGSNKHASKKRQDVNSSTRNMSFLTRFFLLVLVVCAVVTLTVNHVLHPHYHNVHQDHFKENPTSALARSMKDFTELHQELKQEPLKQSLEKQKQNHEQLYMQQRNEEVQMEEETKRLFNKGEIKWGTLNCEAHGGPSPEVAQEMVYWQDVPSDSHYKSPYHSQDTQPTQYMTFEPDGGGWNNIRMAMETVLALAHATGRTLVMPPEQRMYLLGKNQNKQRSMFGFADFFPIQEIAQEHVGLNIISMQEFLETQAMTGKLVDKTTGQPTFPPDNNRTDWNGQKGVKLTLLKEYLRNVTHVAMWRPGDCIAAFPSSSALEETEKLTNMKDTALQLVKQGVLPNKNSRHKHPTPIHASPTVRMAELLSGRQNLCVYDSEMQQAPVVHFMCFHKMRIRLLVHFYCFLFFENWQQDVWTKRFIRDHVRYIDQVQCAAARVVHAVRQRALQHGNTTQYDSFHIRRGDFQFKSTRISAQEIYKQVKDELREGATVYIATDERDLKFFDFLKQHYHVLFLSDFQTEIKGLNTNYYGMLDQLVASRGQVFFGCWFSTFTGYITRMRGYYSQKEQWDGYRDGVLYNTYYYATPDKKHSMMEYNYWNTFAREFPTSWRSINGGIGQEQPQT